MTPVPFPPQTLVDYPESDGQPIGESLQHVLVITHLLSALTHRFRNHSDVYVGANNLIYYVEGFPNFSFAPDVYVIPGMDKTPRNVLKLWQEQVSPSVIIEITSSATWTQDLGDKKDLYKRLGVREYFIYDVLHEALAPALRSYRLVNSGYEPIAPDSKDRFYSTELQLRLQEIEGTLRLVNPDTDEILKNYIETATQIEIERERAQAAEQEIERLRAEIERLRSQSQST